MSYADIEERKQQLIRKALKGSVFIADITADPITALTAGATADLSPLPTGYSDLGWLTEEGMPFGRDVGQSNVTSFGSQTPTRSDVTSDTTTSPVTVSDCTAAQAEQVIAERINPDEDYGFDYTISYEGD